MEQDRQSGRTRGKAPPWIGTLIAAFVVAWMCPAPAAAYVGPGAGFAFVGAFFVLLWALLLALFTLVSYPFRLLVRLFRRRRLPAGAPRRVVVIGLDGMDPKLTERWMAAGKLPHFTALAAEGAFRRLSTTHPPLSPVAWSSFMTGVHPARHGIFDFLARDARSYLPFLSSSAIEPARRSLSIGKFQVPLGRPQLRLFRKAPPFWKILGDHGVFSSVLRVPVTFPPERFHGTCLSGMSVPDLRGTQGSFTFFTEGGGDGEHTGGMRVPLTRTGNRLHGSIPGPEHPLHRGQSMQLPIEVEIGAAGTIELRAGTERLTLQPGVYSDWIPLVFDAGFAIKPRGIARFRIVSTEPSFGLYMTPINIDPEHPALPISHPRAYGTYLAKLLGRFATLGLAEDTWALNERVLDEDGFLEQAYLIHAEREEQLFDALDKTPSGVVVCVFDATDRVQHMFYRYTDPDPRAPRPGDVARYARVIEDLYVRMDTLLGRVRAELDGDTLLFVLSDHGFASFRRCVDLNAWLRQEGYLTLKDGATGTAEYLRDVDWSRTQAYAVGLAGLYLNLRGRESQGIVAAGATADGLKREIAAKLLTLHDADGDRPVVRDAVDVAQRYSGPYCDEAPDLIVGYADGYRVSWDAAVGKVTNTVLTDNAKSWSGDHCVDPELVPGILFCNRPMRTATPSIVDIAPSLLEVYGIRPPAHMEGRSLGIQPVTATS